MILVRFVPCLVRQQYLFTKLSRTMPSSRAYSDNRNTRTRQSQSTPRTNSSEPQASGPTQKEDGPVYFYSGIKGTACLSQFFMSEFTAPLPTKESILALATSSSSEHAAQQAASESQMQTFYFAEQYMMYSKAVFFGAPDIADLILAASTPRECKSLGRMVPNFTDAEWDPVKERIVEEGNYAKFTRGVGDEGKKLREILMGTGDRELVEASPTDRVWGIGFKVENAEKNRGKWGQNLLGKALVVARARIREEEKAAET